VLVSNERDKQVAICIAIGTGSSKKGKLQTIVKSYVLAINETRIPPIS